MTPFDPGDQKTLRLHGNAPGASKRLAWAVCALALLAFMVGVLCIIWGQWGAGLALTLIGVAAAVASVRPMFAARQMQRRMRERSQSHDRAT